MLASIAQRSPAADKVTLPVNLTVAAGQRERVDSLVQCQLPEYRQVRLRLIETTDGKESPVSVQTDPLAAKIWWVAGGKTAAGAQRTYRLEAADAAAPESVAVAVSDRTIELRHGEQPLLKYARAHVEPGAGVNPRYGRSAHLHPVWTPSGAVVTDEFPPDHLHQSGIFLAFTKTEFKGHEIDFWNLGGGKGRVRFKQYIAASGGPVYGQILTQQEHVDLTATADARPGDKTAGEVVLNEDWQVRAWSTGLASGYWLLDIDSQLTCASEQPLKLPEYHYGGMAIRAARDWKPQQVKFLTSLGDDRLKGNHTRPKWCEISGAVDGKQVGVTLMTHPDNFRFPEPLRIHPTMPYMVYTPSFLGDWEIRPQQPHRSRYRFVIHDGELPAQTLDRLWQDYAEPLTATVAR
jgi:hypothetical protein